MATCLVVEDAPGQAANLVRTLQLEGHEVAQAGTLAQALASCRELQPDVVLLDLGLPDGDGLDAIPELIRLHPLTRVVVLTGRDSVKTAVAALRAGARHYLVKPWDNEELLLVVEREARSVAATATLRRERSGEVFWSLHPHIVRLQGALEKLSQAAFTTVLLEGETGSGKEIVARELHRLTAAGGEFVAVNCAAVPTELLESELFGHERGSFTGAEYRRKGLVELATDGTLFLDEVAEMAPQLQTKLLRFLEDHRFRRVGGEEERVVRCRVVAATHRNLREFVEDGRFRSDLYFRLAVVQLSVPPLRERRDDILPLSHFLLNQLARQLGKPPRQFSSATERVLVEHSWPGNVRELRNRLERALVLSEGMLIEPEDLDLPSRGGRGMHAGGVRETRGGPAAAGKARPLSEAQQAEAERIARAWRAEGYSIARTARRLGVPRHWLKYRLTKYAIAPVEKE